MGWAGGDDDFTQVGTALRAQAARGGVVIMLHVALCVPQRAEPTVHMSRVSFPWPVTRSENPNLEEKVKRTVEVPKGSIFNLQIFILSPCLCHQPQAFRGTSPNEALVRG